MKTLKIICMLLFSTSLLKAEEVPQSMGALGDSMTAAAFARFNRTDARSPFLFPKIVEMILKAGYTASLKAFEYRELSWSTGLNSETLSHAGRLKELNQNLDVVNVSVSGATSNDLMPQVEGLLKWSHQKLSTGAPDYVTLIIGANDACGKNNERTTSLADYSDNVKEALERILAANKKTKILIGGIPNIEHLRKVAENSTLSGVPPFSTCKEMWKFHGFCNNILIEEDQAKVAIASHKIQSYLHELENIQYELNQKWGDNTVHFASEIYDYNFTDNNISLDCFHPNKAGQQILSDITWEKSWW